MKNILVFLILSFFPLGVFAAQNTLADGLLGRWTFDGADISGVTAYDKSGQGNNGEITGATKVMGKLGQALAFSGTAQYVAVTSTSFDAFTFSAWYKTTSPSQSAGMIFGDAAASSGGGSKIGLVGGKFFVRAGGTAVNTLTVPTDGAWHLFTVTRSSVGGVRSWLLYLDGKLAQDAGTTPGATAYAFNKIGANGSDLSQLFNGYLDDVRSYGRALSAAEVWQLYNSGRNKIQTSQAASVSPSNRTNPLANGLVGYWTFDGPDISGIIAYDRSGQGNNGEMRWSALVGAAGKFGQALSFDGARWIDAGNSANIQINNGTISGWIKTPGAGSGFRGVVAKQSAYGMFLYENEFGMYDWGTGSWRGSGYSPNDGRWHHLVCTFRSGVSSGTLCYADGVLKLTTTITVSNHTVTLQIGEANAAQLFNGLIDDVRVYNRVLSAPEIWELYISGQTKLQTSQALSVSSANRTNPLANGLIALWTFDGADVSGTVVYDRGGNGYNGTISGAVKTTGKLGQALSFNGTSDYVTSGGVFSALGTSNRPYTISVWAKAAGGETQGNIIHMSSAPPRWLCLQAHFVQ